MPNKPDTPTPNDNVFDPSIQSENIAFAPSELVACGACGRLNPPTRSKCLYCGHELEIESANLTKVKSFIRPMESWERGFNVIFHPSMEPSELSVPDVSSLLSQEIESVEAILAAGKPLPLVRVESNKDAEIVTAKLAGHGLTCSVVSDETLGTNQLPVRLAGIEFGGESITFITFLTLERTEVLLSDLALIIPGFLAESKIDLVEKRRRKGPEIFEEVESSLHETIVDVYSRSDPRGCRIQLAGFDFSCLGAEKGFIAAENIKCLIRMLTKLAPGSKLVDDYGSVRRLLDPVWRIEQHSETQGMKRIGIGKTGLQKVATTSNLQQFTKYSRLQWHLYEQEGITKEAQDKTISTGTKTVTCGTKTAP